MYLKSIFLSFFVFTSILFAQQDSMIMVKKSDLPSNIVQKYETIEKVESFGKWVGLGKEIGTSVKEGLGALTEETDKFSKTGVGKFTMFMIAFKVLGYPIIQLFIGGILLFIGICIFVYYLLNYCKEYKFSKKTIKHPDNSIETTEEMVTLLQTGELNARVGYGFLIFVGYVLITILITFIH